MPFHSVTPTHRHKSRSVEPHTRKEIFGKRTGVGCLMTECAYAAPRARNLLSLSRPSTKNPEPQPVQLTPQIPKLTSDPNARKEIFGKRTGVGCLMTECVYAAPSLNNFLAGSIYIQVPAWRGETVRETGGDREHGAGRQ